MSPLEASLVEGQEINSPTASQVPMEPSDLSRSPLPKLPPTSGNKRRRSSSSAESARKRQSLLPESAPPTEPLKPLLPESNWHCVNCGRPCWGCFTRPEVPPDLASLNEEKDTDRLRMASSPPTQGARSIQSDATQNTTSTNSNKKRKQCADAGIKYVAPKDDEFEIGILIPLNVDISSSQAAEISPKDIFGEQGSTPKSCVILDKEDSELREITIDFQQYQRRRYDEHALTMLCSNSIVLRDRWVPGEGQNIRTSVRRDKWKPKKEGPSIPVAEDNYLYDWDLEPDTTYGVSIRMFDVKHRRELNFRKCQPWLAEFKTMVCPYLTVEYKCTEKTGKTSHATFQNTAASILWLYQRKRIREALGRNLDGLKHFSVTFVDKDFAIWEASFRDDNYYLREVANGVTTTLDGLKLYIEWNNAIHTWGLGANADSFKKDIEALLEKRRSGKQFPTPPSTLSPGDAPQQTGAV